jgi:cyclopropane fatty-acyl-phospholipid synthase-like methyltransferase
MYQRTIMPQLSKQFSAACERNQEAILAQLKIHLATSKAVLEIGSGTGQHAVFFSRHLPFLNWQTSDRAENHESIQAWIDDADNARVLPPILLDVAQENWPVQDVDAVFTANTCHIMAIQVVAAMFAGVGRILLPKGRMIIYGPFNYDGQFTSESNQHFDATLKQSAAHRGIRDIADIQAYANENGLDLHDDIAMPANTRLLIFHKNR